MLVSCLAIRASTDEPLHEPLGSAVVLFRLDVHVARDPSRQTRRTNHADNSDGVCLGSIRSVNPMANAKNGRLDEMRLAAMHPARRQTCAPCQPCGLGLFKHTVFLF